MLSLLRSLPGVALGLVFIAAGFLKALDPAEFARQIDTYGIVTGGAAVVLAYLLIPLELALGTALVVGYRSRLAAALTAALLLLFMGATAYAWSQGKTEGCGCFGSIASRTPGQVLLEDAAFLAFAFLAILLNQPRLSRPRWRPVTVLSVVLAAGIALPAGAYALPIDSLVTDLKVGRQSSDLPLWEAPMDLAKGNYLVALLDVNAADSRETVKRLNELNRGQGGTMVVAFFGGEVDEKTIFCFNTTPSFEVVAVPRSDLKRLYRKLPRFFQLKEGRVYRIWDGAPPTPEEVS
ncbi:MAG: DoxX family membrane protein [Acidobacteria bacterium]|nr:DoxX family membrane protein [Acidobacteriota bacterium]